MAEEEIVSLLTPCKSLVEKLNASDMQYRLSSNEVALMQGFQRLWKCGLYNNDPRLKAIGLTNEELSTLVGMLYNPPLYFHLLNQFND